MQAHFSLPWRNVLHTLISNPFLNMVTSPVHSPSHEILISTSIIAAHFFFYPFLSDKTEYGVTIQQSQSSYLLGLIISEIVDRAQYLEARLQPSPCPPLPSPLTFLFLSLLVLKMGVMAIPLVDVTRELSWSDTGFNPGEDRELSLLLL